MDPLILGILGSAAWPEWLHDFAECVSLALTFPTIVFGLAVVVLFWKDARTAVKDHTNSRSDCLILGILVGFIGGVFDNVYWAIPWTLDFLDHDAAPWWFRQGVYFNIFSRQFCGAAAAYFHVRAALWPAAPGDPSRLIHAADHGRRIAWRLFGFSSLGAFAHLGTCFAIRWGLLR